MKNLKNPLSLGIGMSAMALLLPSVVMANGNESGHGGGAIYCIGSGGSAPMARLLDLWEAEHDKVHPKTILLSPEPVHVQVAAAMARIRGFNPQLADRMQAVLDHLDQPGSIRALPQDELITFPADAHRTYLPKTQNCYPVGVANYDDTSNILTYDLSVLNAMGPTDQAATLIHEAYFKTLRDGPTHDHYSTDARRFTAAIFAQEPLPFVSPLKGADRAKYECTAGNLYHFYILERPDNTLRFQFTKIAGIDLMDRAVSDTAAVNYSLVYGRERGLEKPGSQDWFQIVLKKMSEGFQPQPRRRTEENMRTEYERFVDLDTVSGFGPKYSVRIHMHDLVTVQGEVCVPDGDGQTCRSPRNAPCFLHANWKTEISMSGTQGSEAALSCKSL